ncbi:MAG: hypothetical protein NT061_07705 [Spirochaetes bacterium]|nr:hypothetical protein [Spirochaetota bacterium]
MIVNALCRTYDALHQPKPAKTIQPGEKSGDTIFGLSARRITSAFETAKKFVSALITIREGGKERLSEILQNEKKKSLKFSLSLLASPLPEEKIRGAYAEAGLAGSDDRAEECENVMLMTGVRLAVGNAHPITIMRAMTAYLGFGVFDAAETWLLQRFAPQVDEEEDLIVPGELPDLVAELDGNPGLLSQGFRLAGPKLIAAALAGCPKETNEVMKSAALSRLGCLLLDAEIIDARNRLSSDELADAQDAFCALLNSLNKPGHHLEGTEEEWGKRVDKSVDKNLVSDLTELIMELDRKSLRTVMTGLEPDLAATLIQTMTPVAHDRLFSVIPQSRSKRILDALEAASPLSAVELTRSAQLFAQKVLAELVPKTKSLGKALPLPAKLRQALTAILSRE